MKASSTPSLPGLSIPAMGSQAATVRLLSLWQPWASLVAIGAKRIETRSWQTSYRGRIAIHASLNTPKAERQFCYSDPFFKSLYQHVRPRFDAGESQQGNAIYRVLPKGCIVATCDLVGCVEIPPQVHRYFPASLGVPPTAEWNHRNWLKLPPDGDELYFGDYTPGRYAWLLTNIQPLAEPLPWKGAQGLRAIQWLENNPVQGP